MESLEYKVIDRSILLPYYRRWLVDPVLPRLPESLSPNTITHVGHLLNFSAALLLLATGAKSGAPFIVAMLLLNAYVWCDNGDGAHARRTGQCSPLGEYLDHGLDILNTVYIGVLTAAALGAPPLWWVAIALLIPGAGAAAYWEQAQGGVFRLGLLNQIESVLVLSIVMILSAVYGIEFWEKPFIGGVTLRLAMLLWSLTTILFGVVRGMIRVAMNGLGKVVPMLALIACWTAIAGAAAASALTTIEAVTIATSVNIYFGVQMLGARLERQRPRVDYAIVLGACALGIAILVKMRGIEVATDMGAALALTACAVFGGLAAQGTRKGLRQLDRMTA